MTEIRLSSLIKQFNVGLDTLVDVLNALGADIESASPNIKVSDEYMPELYKKFGKDLKLKEIADKVDVKIADILSKPYRGDVQKKPTKGKNSKAKARRKQEKRSYERNRDVYPTPNKGDHFRLIYTPMGNKR